VSAEVGAEGGCVRPVYRMTSFNLGPLEDPDML
jgi:hypothetical protein